MNDRTCNRCNKELSANQKKFCSHSCANKYNIAKRSEALSGREQKLCDVEGCEKDARSIVAALCKMHYHRQYRTGSLDRVNPWVLPEDERIKWTKTNDIRGRRFGTLVVLSREGREWKCACDCGLTRLVNAGNLNRYGDSNTCGLKANHLAEVVGYTAAHERVRRLHGLASTHACLDCGSPAYHWSYQHNDPEELIDLTLSANGVAYSLKPECYAPRCVPCHKRFDLDRINAGSLAFLPH